MAAKAESKTSKKNQVTELSAPSPARVLAPELGGAALVFFSLFSLLALYGPDRGAVLMKVQYGLSLVWGRHAVFVAVLSGCAGAWLLSRRHKRFYKRLSGLFLAWVLLIPTLDHLFATLLYGQEVIIEHLWVFSAGGKFGNALARVMVKGLGVWGALLTYVFLLLVLVWSRTGFSFKTVLQGLEDAALFLGVHLARAWDALRPLLGRLAGDLQRMPGRMAVAKQAREAARQAALQAPAPAAETAKRKPKAVVNEDAVIVKAEVVTEEEAEEGEMAEEASEAVEEKPKRKRKALNPFTRYEDPKSAGESEEDEVILHQEITSLEETGEEEAAVEAVGEEEEAELEGLDDGHEPEGNEFEVETVGLCSKANTSGEPKVVRHDDMSYILPPSFLLMEPVEDTSAFDQDEAERLRQTLEDFNVQAKITRVLRGPNVTRYELSLPRGVKVRKIVELQDEIAMSLAAQSVRIQAPIPGKNAIGVELPRKDPVTVAVREILDSETFNSAKSKLTVAIGKDVTGQPIVANLASMPHLLIAGATGQGKSVCLNVLITSLLVKATPFEVKLILIDPKRVEFPIYSRVPHLLCPVVEDSRQAINALQWVADEMTRRYELLKSSNKRNVEDYNNSVGTDAEKLPRIVVIVDELNDLLMTSLKRGSVEELICRIAQLARAAGIHLVLATQRPDVKVITGTIKANIPCRIAFATTSQVDSRTIIDLGGAEKLLGRGDMLFLHGGRNIQRLQGAFLGEEEIEKVVQFCAKQMAPQYNEEILTHGQEDDGDEDLGEYLNGVEDDRFEDALRLVMSTQQASTSYLQRKLGIGYNRAAKIIDIMEEKGIVEGPDPSKPSAPRKVLVQPAVG